MRCLLHAAPAGLLHTSTRTLASATATPRRVRAAIPPTAVAIRQLAGLPQETDEASHKQSLKPLASEPPEVQQKRLAAAKRERNVSKAAEIEAKRLARERLIAKAVLPSEAIPEGTLPKADPNLPPPSPAAPQRPQQQRPATPPLEAARRARQAKEAMQAHQRTKPLWMESQSSSASATPSASPFKAFDPFFDYVSAVTEASGLDAPSGARNTAQSPTVGKSSSGASPTQPPSKQKTSQPQRSASAPQQATPSLKPKMSPAEIAASVGSFHSPRVSYSPTPSRPLRASKILAARAEELENAKLTIKEVQQQGLKAAKEALEGKEGGTSDAPPSADLPPTQPAAPPRGPSSRTATLKANKHGVGDLAATVEAAQTQQQQEERERKAERKRKKKQAKQQAAASSSKPADVGPDGKIPLQPAGAPVQAQPALAWHPALYTRQFLRKIHPDMYHTASTGPDGEEQLQPVSIGGSDSTAAGGKRTGDEQVRWTAGETMVQTNQETVARFNAIVDYYKQMKSVDAQ
jgi:hypothetical protein